MHKMKKSGLIMIGIAAGVMLSLNLSAVAQKETASSPLPVEELRTFADRILVRCISPVGRVFLENHHNAVHASTAKLSVRLGGSSGFPPWLQALKSFRAGNRLPDEFL